jgi:hypothetical protein
MAMRTGKSKVILDDFGRLELAGLAHDLMVIGPAGALPPWLGEVEAHLSSDLYDRVKVHYWKSGGGVGHAKALKIFLEKPLSPRILFMNVEALSSVKEAREVAIRFLTPRRSYLAIDEATVIKNPTAKRTKFVLNHLAQYADWRRILSGLLTPRSPLDAYAPFFFLDWRIIGQRSYYAFRNRYAILRPEWYGGRHVQIIDGYQNLEELQAKLAPHSFRCRLEDMYDAPEKIYLRREVELTSEQKRIYTEFKKFATARIEGEAYVTATVVIAQMIRLHQIVCGFTRAEDGTWHDIPENRTATLIEWLEETDEKAIVWCSYDRQLQKLATSLEKHFGPGTVARFWGGNAATREKDEARFKNDTRCRFMVATPAAGGRGREWSASNLNIYASNTNNLEHRDQSEYRPQAVGKLEHVTYGDLVSTGTIDEVFIKALRQKINLADMINKDNYRAWLI